MNSSKGFNLTMQLVIVAIVLILTALTILLISQSRIIGGPEKLEQEGDLQLCLADRESYCQVNRDGCWDAKSAFRSGTDCNLILERPNNSFLYNCLGTKWYSEEDHGKITSGEIDITCSSSRN